MNLQHELEQLGFTLFSLASSVSEAVTLIRSGGIDLALFDVNLGPETSYQIADELQASNIPHPFVTGYGRQGVAHAY